MSRLSMGRLQWAEIYVNGNIQDIDNYIEVVTQRKKDERKMKRTEKILKRHLCLSYDEILVILNKLKEMKLEKKERGGE